jgi:hypothetical protein
LDLRGQTTGVRLTPGHDLRRGHMAFASRP